MDALLTFWQVAILSSGLSSRPWQGLNQQLPSQEWARCRCTVGTRIKILRANPPGTNSKPKLSPALIRVKVIYVVDKSILEPSVRLNTASWIVRGSYTSGPHCCLGVFESPSWYQRVSEQEYPVGLCWGSECAERAHHSVIVPRLTARRYLTWPRGSDGKGDDQGLGKAAAAVVRVTVHLLCHLLGKLGRCPSPDKSETTHICPKEVKFYEFSFAAVSSVQTPAGCAASRVTHIKV
ncbi:hypothetical protein CONLIGDRAFT_138014 [Coniochaeta ligniaria NRRL 30616]|uniref:Uncharacterized protein n=1 Tax=Coniochaeta ligniaria NRRL 30616 TaxID=1408157 RepID=A0A1J7J1C1_9PEZI|nr:hypothetical protein CONLIGDRAFT_138014 [Coniochaeta ligniaria NRRL 30616]